MLATPRPGRLRSDPWCDPAASEYFACRLQPLSTRTPTGWWPPTL